jgi:undecaprenyl-diphosphatase
MGDVAVVITALGSLLVTGPLVLATAVWAAARHRTADAVILVAAFAITWVTVQAAKVAFDRPRPSGSHVLTEGMAYPSGHAANAVAWIACAVVLVRGGSGFATRFAAVTAAVVLAVAIALTRVYLRAHHLSDVEGGLGLAVAIYGVLGVIAVVVGSVRHNAVPRS